VSAYVDAGREQPLNATDGPGAGVASGHKRVPTCNRAVREHAEQAAPATPVSVERVYSTRIVSPRAVLPAGRKMSKHQQSGASSAGSSTAPAALPLAKRPLDYLLIFWFFIFAFSTTFTDLHNFTASVLGVDVTALEHMDLVYPPKLLTRFYFKWARTVDPLLYANPVWWQCIEWVNLLVLTPFAPVAMYAFYRGAAWVRMPAVIVSAFTFYSLIVCIGTTL
jgi:hypothetical protein